ncbi:MAG: PDZ domain-containing protein [bacterium]|nr:PDZ domain-containing protein [bacterium]
MKQHQFRLTGLALVLVAALCVGTSARAEGDLTDPYEIFNRHIEAIGGLDALKAETTSYVETELAVAGLSGTTQTWSKAPIFSREDVDLKILTQSGGDNGHFRWSVDANGQLQIHKDENLLKRRELSRKAADYEYLDPNSSVFDLAFVGLEKVGDVNCYVVKTTNTINEDSSLTLFSTSSLMIEKSIAYTPDSETHTVFSDYREVGGILRSFHQEMTMLPMEQKVSVQLTLYEPNAVVDPSLFEPPGETARDYRFAEGDRVEDLPFEYIYGHIFVKVIVNCRERLWVLDSGAGISLIDSAFAEELGLVVEGEVKAKGIGQGVNIAFTKLPQMSLEGVEFDEQTVGVMDIASLIKKGGMEASGILGYDFISRFVLKIDYANKTMSLYDPETFEYSGPGNRIDAPVKGSILTVPVTVDGSYTGQWCIDLGAGGISMHYPFAEKHGLLERSGVEGVSYGAGGEIISRTVQFESIELAGFAVADPRIDMPLEDPIGGFGDEELDGNLGSSLLRRFTLYLDYTGQQVIVEKGEDFDREFRTEKTGLQIMLDDEGRHEVVIVPPGTPGDKAGFRKGDIILAVNDIDIEHIKDLTALSRIRSAEAGTKLKFTILREDREKDLKVKLKNLY